MKRPAPAGLVVGASASGAGKTVTTLALICALRAAGLAVRAAKAGPDFIDTAFHAAATGAPAANLDPWMSFGRTGFGGTDFGRTGDGPDTGMACGHGLPPALARLLRRLGHTCAVPPPDETVPDAPPDITPDITVVEGVMGLFDGLPAGRDAGAASTAHLAALLDFPVLLVLNARGLGASVAALAEGFLRHRPAAGQWQQRFCGLICTHVGGAAHESMLRAALEPVARDSGCPIIGLLPRAGAPALESRHLGLVEARAALPALAAAGLDMDALARWFTDHCDLDGLLATLGLASALQCGRSTEALSVDSAPPASPEAGNAPEGWPTTFFAPARRAAGSGPRIGIARDEAFSFCYADLPALLAELGGQPCFFSPLRDPAPPPDCAGLYFPGGYPELHAEALAANTGMLAALRGLAARDVPIYGECGGFLYLTRGVEREGRFLPLCGLLPLDCRLGSHLAALGYREATLLPGWLPPLPQGGVRRNAGAPESHTTPLRVRGHEFHYSRLINSTLPAPCAPLWQVRGADGNERGAEGCRLGSVAGTWLHLYPEGSRAFWASWLALAARRQKCATAEQEQ